MAEQLLSALDGQQLYLIHVFAAVVITGARITLGIFIRHYRAACSQHSPARVILRWNHHQRLLLARQLPIKNGGNLRIDLP